MDYKIRTVPIFETDENRSVNRSKTVATVTNFGFY
jgi:hypothetical protein